MSDDTQLIALWDAVTGLREEVMKVHKVLLAFFDGPRERRPQLRQSFQEALLSLEVFLGNRNPIAVPHAHSDLAQRLQTLTETIRAKVGRILLDMAHRRKEQPGSRYWSTVSWWLWNRFGGGLRRLLEDIEQVSAVRGELLLRAQTDDRVSLTKNSAAAIVESREESSGPSTDALKGTRGAASERPAYARDHLWLEWHEKERLGPAKIRNRWNSMSDTERKAVCPTCKHMIGGSTPEQQRSGLECVKSGLKKAAKEATEPKS